MIYFTRRGEQGCGSRGLRYLTIRRCTANQVVRSRFQVVRRPRASQVVRTPRVANFSEFLFLALRCHELIERSFSWFLFLNCLGR